jgi:hypothetical protein
MAYVYPAGLRSTRYLLRRRMHFMYKRSEHLAIFKTRKANITCQIFKNQSHAKEIELATQTIFQMRVFSRALLLISH